MGKIKLKILIGILTILLFANLASAAVNIVEDSIMIEADYEKFTDEDQVNISATTNTITVHNDGLTNETIIVTATGLPEDYATGSEEMTIEPGKNATTKLTLTIPHEQDSGETNIGNIVIKSADDNSELGSVDLIQNTPSMLVFDEIEIDYYNEDGSTESDTLNKEDEELDLSEKVRIGSEFVISFTVENLFDNDYDEHKIKDIEINVDLSSSKLTEDDIDDKYDLENLDGEESDSTVEIRFNISDEEKAKSYDIEFTLEGKDDKSSKHKVVKVITFETGIVDDDLRIIKAEVTPNELSTCLDELSLDFQIKNLGSDDQKYAAYSIFNQELDINENMKDIVLEQYDDSDNTYSETFTFPLEDIKEKKYYLDINTYYNNDKNSDFRRITLDFQKCKVDTPPEPEVVKKVEPTPEENKTKEDAGQTTTTGGSNSGNNGAGDTQVSTSDIVKTVEDPYTQEDYLVAIIVIGIVLVLAMVITFFVVLLK